MSLCATHSRRRVDSVPCSGLMLYRLQSGLHASALPSCACRVVSCPAIMTAGPALDTINSCATADIWQAVVDGTTLSQTQEGRSQHQV